MRLQAFDRMILLNILPTEGDILTLRIVRDLQDALSFTEAEHAALNIRQEPGTTGVKWNGEADQPIDVEIGPVATGLIRDQLARLSEDQKLTLEHVPLYERFVEGKEAD